MVLVLRKGLQYIVLLEQCKLQADKRFACRYTYNGRYVHARALQQYNGGSSGGAPEHSGVSTSRSEPHTGIRGRLTPRWRGGGVRTACG